MVWPNTHARSRKRLSTYIDGRLSPRERTVLEAHLAGCEACRAELNELRATITAVSGLADVEPPRSFTLTPRMLEQRAVAPLAPVPPLATGMRLAGAGVALVLAVVLVGDLASMGDGDSGLDGGGTRQSAEFQMSNSDTGDAAGAGAPEPAATGAAEDNAAIGAERASPDELAASAENADACPSSAGEARDATTAPPAAEPAPSAASADGSSACAPAVENVAPEAETPVGVEPLSADEDRAGAVAPAADSEEDSGVSALTLVEIILAGGFVALAGGIGIEYLLRRRAA